jgi:hypothetical protein
MIAPVAVGCKRSLGWREAAEKNMKPGAQQHQPSDKTAQHHDWHRHAHELRHSFDQSREHGRNQAARHEKGNGKHKQHGHAQAERQNSPAEARPADRSRNLQRERRVALGRGPFGEQVGKLLVSHHDSLSIKPFQFLAAAQHMRFYRPERQTGGLGNLSMGHAFAMRQHNA